MARLRHIKAEAGPAAGVREMADLQVLHVDDEPDMRLLVKLSLELDTGMSTRSASSGPEALDATTYWRPDVILLDAVMPGMDGLATLRALQTNPKTAGIPVLFLTGRCGAGDIDSFKASGSAGVIAKPFDPQALAAAIRGFVHATDGDAAAGVPPDFAGRSSLPAGPDGGLAAATFPIGVPTLAGAVGATTEALLLDMHGNAFALTITDQPGGSSRLPVGPAAPAFAVHVAPLDASTLGDVLGAEPATLLITDDVGMAAWDHPAIQGAAFPIVHASGCSPTRGAMDLAGLDQTAAGLDLVHHTGAAVTPVGDWSALILPRASMH